MDARTFDAMTSRLMTRRRAGTLVSAGAFAVLVGGDPTVGAKKHKKHKQRCQPKPLQAACKSNAQCCTKETGHVCGSNAQGDRCRLTRTVCCLPFGDFGCVDACDCCAPSNVCRDGQCLRAVVI